MDKDGGKEGGLEVPLYGGDGGRLHERVAWRVGGRAYVLRDEWTDRVITFVLA